MTCNGKNVIVGCTGSVATIKVPVIAKKLISLGYNVIVVPTNNALHFLKSQAITDERLFLSENCHGLSSSSYDKETVSNPNNRFYALENEVKSLYHELSIITDTDEWESWQKRGDPVKHVELREWADVLLIAPLDANTLAKIAQGLCDNLLTCIVRAWDLAKPLIFCPAMNTYMYNHPLTAQHIDILKKLKYEEIEVTSKTLICGDTGLGAMAEVDTIIHRINTKFQQSS